MMKHVPVASPAPRNSPAVAWLRWPKRRAFLRLYIPFAEPRVIEEDSIFHGSVLDRMRMVPGYGPVNLPAAYSVET